MAIFTGTAGADSFIGADAEADSFRFTPATLGAADTVSGGGGAVTDSLQFIAAGAIAPAQLAGVSGIERILHHAGGNSYALTAALVAGGVGGFEARGAAGADSVDGSGLADPLLRISFFAGGGADTMIGGAGNDTFSVLSAFAGARHFAGGGGNDLLVTQPAYWSGSDAFLGGAGVDRLLFNASGSIAAAALAGLASVEEIQFGNALSLDIALNDAAVAQAGGTLAVLGGAQGAQRVDASAVTTGSVRYIASTGGDTFIGGAGDDRFEVAEAISTGNLGDGDDVLRLTSKLAQGILVDGGAGHDVLELFAGGTWDLTGLTGFEEVELLAASTLRLSSAEGFRVLGSAGRDVITLGGPRQTVAGFGGDDVVAITAATMVGSVLSGGGQTSQDVLRLDAAGNYDFRRAAITGFEKIEQVAVPGGFSSIQLANQPIEVVLRHSTLLVMGANADQSVWGSARGDGIVLGATGQFVDAGGGDDQIVSVTGFLGAGTVIAGGPGFDELRIDVLAPGQAVDLATGALVIGVERIAIAAGAGNPGLALTLDDTPGLEIKGGAGADTVTGGGGGLHGDLGGGDDLLRISNTLLTVASAATMSGGGGTDTMLVLDDPFAPFSFTILARFGSFDVVDISGIGSHGVTFEGAEARRVLMGAGPLTVFGSGAAEEFVSAGAFNFVNAGDGADTIRQTVAPDSGQSLLGDAGDDVIVYDLGAASATTLMPTTWVAETVRLIGNHSFSTTTQSGLVVIGDPTLGNTITLRGNSQRAQGGAGADTLRNFSGFNTTLAGGNGADFYLTNVAEQTLWDTPGQTITDTSQAFALDTLRIFGSGTLSIDFEEHTVTHIDRIEIMDPGAAARLTLTDALVSTADGNNGGAPGDLTVTASVVVTAGVSINGGNLTGANFIRFSGTFDGADTVTGGAGADLVQGAGGNDSLVGNGGNDTIDGGGGGDTIIPGAGADSVIGGTGGDVINLAEGASSLDRVNYASAADGTVDINDAASVSVNTADSLLSFNPAADKIRLDQSGLGLGAGGIVAVAANGAWNIGTGAVFLFESDSGNSDTLNSNSFADLNAIAFAVNSDNAAGFGSSVGRTVALVVSNPETQVVRQTGLYVWTDTDGDSLLEAGDVVRLLAVFQGVTANQLVTGSSVELF